MNIGNKRVGIAMPVFNESDGIATTLRNIDKSLDEGGFVTELFIQDDCSTDKTIEVIARLTPELKMSVKLQINDSNKGHGPTTFNAYNRAVKSDNSIILQLDSDGQFDPKELPLLLDSVTGLHKVALGVRIARKDPWFRKTLTRFLGTYLSTFLRCKSSDPNSPVRAYDRSVLQDLIKFLPEEPLIPNIYLTVLSTRLQIPIKEVAVAHRVRHGASKTGTMWRSGRSFRFLIPKRLLIFSYKALLELWRFKRSLRTKI